MKTKKTSCYLTVMTSALLMLYGCKESPEETESVTDTEGNTYGTMLIGDQVWMTENLRTIAFRDGSWMLTDLHEDYEWASAGAACAIYPYYDIEGFTSESDVLNAYGLLYNWQAVTDSRGLCPVGWRVPTDEDWAKLVENLGGEDVAGGKLKSTRTEPTGHPRWSSPNTGATDNYGFSALPAGYRTSIGEFMWVGYGTYFWSSSQFDATFAVVRYIDYESASFEEYYKNKKSGYPVRCVKE